MFQEDLIQIFICLLNLKVLIKWDESLLTFKPDKPFQNTITLGSVSGNFSYQKTYLMKLIKNLLF